MKTKAEILKMPKREIEEYAKSLKLKKRDNKSCSDCSECSNCSDCSDCSNCSNCSNCFDCSDCYECSGCYDCSYCFGLNNGRFHQYKILNVQFTKEEYENKIKTL